MPTPPPTLRAVPQEIIDLFDRALNVSRADVERIFGNAVGHVTKTWNYDDLATSLTQNGDLERFLAGEGLEALEDFSRIFKEVYDGKLDAANRRIRHTAPLVETYVNGSDAALQTSPIPESWWSQSRITDEAIRWIDTEGAKRVVGINDATVGGMRAIVKEAFEVDGIGEAGIKRALLAMDGRNGVRFGLDPRAAKSYSRWIDENITAKDIKGKRAQALMDRRYKQLLRRRAESIAHTESVTAANAGQVLTHELAAAEGQLDTLMYVLEWVARANKCKRCAAFDGSTREVSGGVFTSDGTWRGRIETARFPDVHTNGWCFTRSIRRSEASRQPGR